MRVSGFEGFAPLTAISRADSQDVGTIVSSTKSARNAGSSITAGAVGTAEIEVRTIGGNLIGDNALAVDLNETVIAFKERLARKAGMSSEIKSLRLVFGCVQLQDHKRLEECGVSSEGANMQLVTVGASSLAMHLEHHGLENHGILDVVDSVFQAEHQVSQKHMPQPEAVCRAMDAHRRGQVVSWMTMACNAMRFDDSLLHGSVLNLDRFYATRSEPLEESQLFRLSLAAICTEMKLATVDLFPSGYWQRVLNHLSQGHESLEKILQTEAKMLSQLGFVTGIPTPLTFLRGLGLRFAGSSQGKQRSGAAYWKLASFLLELALYDPELEYRYPHSVLAAGALGAALLSAGAESADASTLPPESVVSEHKFLLEEELDDVHETLLEDLASYCPDVHSSNLRKQVRDCEKDLLLMWKNCMGGVGPWVEFYTHLNGKHAPHMAPAPGDASTVNLFPSPLLGFSNMLVLEKRRGLHPGLSNSLGLSSVLGLSSGDIAIR